MRRRIVLVGGGGHGRVIGEALLAAHPSLLLVGFVDPQLQEETAVLLGVPRLGDDDELDPALGDALSLGVGAVGIPRIRVNVEQRLSSKGWEWISVVHPTAYVSSSAILAEGATVLARAVVNAGAKLGRHSLVNTGAIIEHDVVIGDHTVVSPGVIIGGGSNIGRGAFIGLGAVIRDNIEVGSGAVIGMGSVVVKDVLAGQTVLGVPARPIPPSVREQ